MRIIIYSILAILITCSFSFAEFLLVPSDYPNIQTGIDKAEKGDVVLVAEGTYFENINFKGKAITVASFFLLERDTAIISKTIIHGGEPQDSRNGSVVSFTSGEDTNSVLIGFTITGGNGSLVNDGESRSGGGIVCVNSGAKIVFNKIERNLLKANVPSYGAGIGHSPSGDASFIIVENNWITNNTVKGDALCSGGAVHLYGGGRISNNEIMYNQCRSMDDLSHGGGISAWGKKSDSKLQILDNFIAYNKAHSFAKKIYGGFGGGLWLGGYAVSEVIGNRFESNEVSGAKQSYGAGVFLKSMGQSNKFCSNHVLLNFCSGRGHGNGGGLYLWKSSLCLYNNIIFNNRSSYGGGMYIFSTYTEEHINDIHKIQFTRILNNTIADNTAYSKGGGVYTKDSQPILLNSIVWGNSAPEYAGLYNAFGRMDVRYSDIQNGRDTNDNICADPLFVKPSYKLSEASPCIGAGVEKVLINGSVYICPECCIYGNSRPSPVKSRPDMGAYESLLGTPTLSGFTVFENTIPEKYTLKQNYPNPFNPETTIEFSIPNSEYVTLRIFNSLGQEVETLVSENLTPGSYSTSWNASDFASGVYYYKIEAGNFKQFKKLLLVK